MVYDFVRNRREELGLTHKEVAERAGFSVKVAKRFEEKRPYNPNVTQTIKLAKALNVSSNTLGLDCEWEFE